MSPSETKSVQASSTETLSPSTNPPIQFQLVFSVYVFIHMHQEVEDEHENPTFDCSSDVELDDGKDITEEVKDEVKEVYKDEGEEEGSLVVANPGILCTSRIKYKQPIIVAGARV